MHHHPIVVAVIAIAVLLADFVAGYFVGRKHGSVYDEAKERISKL